MLQKKKMTKGQMKIHQEKEELGRQREKKYHYVNFLYF